MGGWSIGLAAFASRLSDAAVIYQLIFLPKSLA